jgi:hypothetical protein
MTNVATLERNTVSMKRADEEEILQILDRIEKLSQRPENPGIASRNLETINALMNTLRERLGHNAKV